MKNIIKENFTLAGYDDVPIVGDVTLVDHPEGKIMLFVHGFKGFKDWGTHELVANYFAEKGIPFIKFNFSHAGVNPSDLTDVTDFEKFSNNTPSKELHDLNVIIDYISQRFPANKIILTGHSRGGALSLLQAVKDERIDYLITWAAISSFRNLWKIEDEEDWLRSGINYTFNGRTQQKMPLSVSLLNDVIQHQQEYDLNHAAQQIKIPWLIVQGTQDAAVKTIVGEEFHRLQPKFSQLLIVQNADHVFGAYHPYDKDYLPADLEKVCEACAKFILKG